VLDPESHHTDLGLAVQPEHPTGKCPSDADPVADSIGPIVRSSLADPSAPFTVDATVVELRAPAASTTPTSPRHGCPPGVGHLDRMLGPEPLTNDTRRRAAGAAMGARDLRRASGSTLRTGGAPITVTIRGSAAVCIGPARTRHDVGAAPESRFPGDDTAAPRPDDGRMTVRTNGFANDRKDARERTYLLRSAPLVLKLIWYAGRRRHARLSARAFGPATRGVA
jgi:hypothetical protein